MVWHLANLSCGIGRRMIIEILKRWPTRPLIPVDNCVISVVWGCKLDVSMLLWIESGGGGLRVSENNESVSWRKRALNAWNWVESLWVWCWVPFSDESELNSESLSSVSLSVGEPGGVEHSSMGFLVPNTKSVASKRFSKCNEDVIPDSNLTWKISRYLFAAFLQGLSEALWYYPDRMMTLLVDGREKLYSLNHGALQRYLPRLQNGHARHGVKL